MKKRYNSGSGRRKELKGNIERERAMEGDETEIVIASYFFILLRMLLFCFMLFRVELGWMMMKTMMMKTMMISEIMNII